MPGANEKAIARWSSVPFQTISEDTFVGVVADHFGGIDRVEFSLDGGPWVAVYHASTNPSSLVKEYFCQLPLSLLQDGQHEIRAIAYPKNGLPRVLAGPFTPNIATGNHSLFLSSNRDGSLPTNSVWVSPSGSDSSGNGSQNNPFKTLMRAAHALAGNVFEGDVGGGTIYLTPGDYNLGTYTYAWKIKNPTRYLTIEPAPGVSKSAARIISSSSNGLWTDLVRFKNLTIAPQLGASGIIRNANNFGIAWFDGVHFESSDFNDPSSSSWYVGWATRIFTNSTAKNVRETPFNGLMAQNCSVEHVADDAFKNVLMVTNALVKDLKDFGTGAHPDVWQLWKPGGTIENCIVQQLSATESIAAQGLFFHGFTSLFKDCSFREIVIDNSDNGQGTVAVNLHMHRPVKHLLIRDSLLITGGLYRTGDDPQQPGAHNIFSAEHMLIENTFADAQMQTFLVPPPDGPSALVPNAPWPGTLPWLSPLGVLYQSAP
jgi:hypothetical protein